MTGVRKGEEQVSIPLRRDGSWACGHVLMWTWKSASIAALCSLIGHSAFHGHMKPGPALRTKLRNRSLEASRRSVEDVPRDAQGGA